MDTALRCHIKVSSSAKADDPVFQGTRDEVEKPRRTGCPVGACHRARRRRGPLAGYGGISPACFPNLLAPNRDREIGGGRATRQSGQVRKEAALTRSGSGRSSISYLFFRANRAGSGPCPSRARSFPQAGRERLSIADRPM